MADRKPVDNKSKRIVRPKLDGAAKAGSDKLIKAGTRTRRAEAYRAKIAALLAELPCERLVLAWKMVCPSLIATAFDLPDRQGMIQDLADFAGILRPDLQGITADRLCRQIEKYGGAANRTTKPPVLRPKPMRVKIR